MRSYEIPGKMVRVIVGYALVLSAHGQFLLTSDWFMIKSGVKQGWVMPVLIFLQCLDWVTRTATADKRRGIR